MAIPIHQPLESLFRQFASESRGVLATQTRALISVEGAFRDFVLNAKRRLISDLPRQLAILAPRVRCLYSWLLPPAHDLLDVAGLTYAEDSYTDLMAWSLHPATHAETALQRQSRWLLSLGIPEADSLDETTEPTVQFSTEYGRPDLILRYARFVVVVEAKTGSDEHLVRASGLPQSETYPDAVRKKLGLDEIFPVHMVFLTPDGRQPSNREAISTTYLQFAVSLAAALNDAELPAELRFGFRLWVTHLATCAVPRGIDFRKVLEDLGPLLEVQEGVDAESSILHNLDNIDLLLTLLPRWTRYE